MLGNNNLFDASKVEWIAELHVVFELTADSDKLHLTRLKPLQEFMQRQTVNGGLRRAYETLRELVEDVLNTNLYHATGSVSTEEATRLLHKSLKTVYGQLVGTLQSLDRALEMALNRWPRMPDWDRFVLQLCAGNWASRFLVMARLIMQMIELQGLVTAIWYEWRTTALLRTLPPISAPGNSTEKAVDEWDWPIGEAPSPAPTQ